jgi:hypothetical protein
MILPAFIFYISLNPKPLRYLFEIKCVEEADYITHHMELGILVNPSRSFRLAIASHIWCYGMKTYFSQSRHLVPP